MKIAIAGCLGRMGQTLLRVGSATPGITLTAGSILPDTDMMQARAALITCGVPNLNLVAAPEALFDAADAVIDFTEVSYSLLLAAIACDTGKTHVIGTTGFSDIQVNELNLYAEKARIVKSGNFSIGVNVVEMLIEKAASMLDSAYDIEVLEMHHKHKKDAPSGTAIMLADAAARGRKTELAETRRHYAEGHIGAREEGTIGISVRRGGEVIGDHTVTFAGSSELIDITHRSQSRDIYALGAFKAAKWASARKPGLYSMRDMVSA